MRRAIAFTQCVADCPLVPAELNGPGKTGRRSHTFYRRNSDDAATPARQLVHFGDRMIPRLNQKSGILRSEVR